MGYGWWSDITPESSRQQQLPAVQFNGMVAYPINVPFEQPLAERILGHIEEAVGHHQLEERILPVQ